MSSLAATPASEDADAENHAAVDWDSFTRFNYEHHLFGFDTTKPLHFVGFNEGIYGTSTRCVRMDAAGSLVGLMKPFSLIIKPSVNCDGKGASNLRYN